MVATPVIDRVKPTTPEIAADIAGQDAHKNNPTFVTLDQYRAIAETAEERLELQKSIDASSELARAISDYPSPALEYGKN